MHERLSCKRIFSYKKKNRLFKNHELNAACNVAVKKSRKLFLRLHPKCTIKILKVVKGKILKIPSGIRTHDLQIRCERSNPLPLRC